MRGYGFEISERFTEHGLHRTVSVPLRGYGFEMPTQNKSSLYYVYGFPSPCGDMVLKSPLIRKELVVYCAFPSPCGDMVLKLRLACCADGEEQFVSVPLRGYGFEILAAGCLAVPSSICRFAARMYFPPLSRRHCVLKAAVCPTALSAAGISLSV